MFDSPASKRVSNPQPKFHPATPAHPYGILLANMEEFAEIGGIESNPRTDLCLVSFVYRIRKPSSHLKDGQWG
jgi:hypothetical protein